MSKTENFNIYKDIPCIIKARANGKWDYSTVTNFTTDNQNVSVNMTAYDGLSHNVIPNYQSVDTYDFSGTILPWKWQYNRYLQTKQYAFDEVGQNHTVTLLGGYNFDCYGAVTISNSDDADSKFMVSNFSTINYIMSPIKPQFSTLAGWTLSLVFKTGSSVTTEQYIYSSGILNSSGVLRGIRIAINSSSKLVVGLSFDGETLGSSITGTTTLATNTYYYLSLGFDGSNYQLSLNDNIEGTLSSTSKVANGDIEYIGCWKDANGIKSPFNAAGKIYSISSLITYDENQNSTLYNLLDNNQVKQQAGNYGVTGSPVVSQTFIASNFGTSSYLTIDQIPSSISSFEMIFRVRTPTSLSTSHMVVLGQSSANYKTPQIDLSSGGYFCVMATAEGSSPWANTANTLPTQTTVSFNTWYWLKATWDGSTLNLYLSTDNQNWNHEGTVACSAVYWGENARVGRDNDSSSIYTGMIDLKNSYININGQRWWSGTTYVTESLPGCTYNYNGEQTVNCFVVNYDQSIVLTPDNTYTDGYLLGTVTI